MIYAFFWTLLGIPIGYLTSILINDVYVSLYGINIPIFLKNTIITMIIFLSFLKGYTGNDLITNIYLLYL